MTSAWLETLGSLVLAFAGVGLGMLCARLPGRWWMFGYFAPLVLVGLMGLPRWFPELAFTPPMSWLAAGRRKFALAGMLATWLLTTPFSRLPQVATRRLVVLFMVLLVLGSSVSAFLSPALAYNALRSLTTRVNPDGVCLQSNDYTCGPASAVTALRRLGLKAEEGEIAILAHASPMCGTPPDVLADALAEHFANQRLTTEYRFFKTVREMKGVCEVLAVTKFGFLTDHYVAVLDVTDTEIVVGDPLSGRASYKHDDFAKTWRFAGVVIKRTAGP